MGVSDSGQRKTSRDMLKLYICLGLILCFMLCNDALTVWLSLGTKEKIMFFDYTKTTEHISPKTWMKDVSLSRIKPR